MQDYLFANQTTVLRERIPFVIYRYSVFDYQMCLKGGERHLKSLVGHILGLTGRRDRLRVRVVKEEQGRQEACQICTCVYACV